MNENLNIQKKSSWKSSNLSFFLFLSSLEWTPMMIFLRILSLSRDNWDIFLPNLYFFIFFFYFVSDTQTLRLGPLLSSTKNRPKLKTENFSKQISSFYFISFMLMLMTMMTDIAQKIYLIFFFSLRLLFSWVELYVCPEDPEGFQ